MMMSDYCNCSLVTDCSQGHCKNCGKEQGFFGECRKKYEELAHLIEQNLLNEVTNNEKTQSECKANN
jgi:hypothetical protein